MVPVNKSNTRTTLYSFSSNEITNCNDMLLKYTRYRVHGYKQKQHSNTFLVLNATWEPYSLWNIT